MADTFLWTTSLLACFVVAECARAQPLEPPPAEAPPVEAPPAEAPPAEAPPAEAPPAEPPPVVEESTSTALSDLFQIHGYGNWRAGITDGENQYLYGEQSGRFESASFTLVLHAMPFRSLRFVASQEIGVEELGEELELELDFVFAEWSINDWFAVILGAGPFPSGVYTEIYDVGTLRPFLALPQSVYGFNGTLGENLIGLQLRFRAPLGPVAAFELIAFGGAAQFETKLPFAVWALDDDASDAEIEELDEEVAEVLPRIAGLRAVLQTPIEGLSVGASGYVGEREDEEEGEESEGDHLHAVATAFVTWALDPFKLQLEYLFGDLTDARVHGGYVEASYALTPEWQIALRGDVSRFELDDEPSVASSLAEHLDVSFGLGYWVATDFTIQAAYHFVAGNLYARPEATDLYEAVQDDRLEAQTHYGELGMAFSF